MKILFAATVISHLKAFHEPYMDWFQKQGWEVHAVGNEDMPLQFCDKKYLIPVARSPLKLQNIKALLKLRKIIENEHYDIIHCHTPMGAVLTRLAAIKARRQGTKVIYTAHGFHFFTGAPRINWLVYYPLERILAKVTDVLITINQEDYQRAKKFSAKKVVYVPGVGVDIDRFKAADNRKEIRKRFGVQDNHYMILSVGELISRKNHEIVLDSIAKLNDSNIIYVICGVGPLENELKQKAKRLGIESQVVFAGYCTNIPEIYRAADIFIFPSLQEGLPVALMEAMAAGLPIIASNIRGNNDLITHKKNGYLLSGGVESYKIAIQKLMDSKKRREIFGRQAQKTIQQYSLKVVKDQMEKIYKICMK